MEVLFNWCCEVMQSLANFTGFTYKEVNVIVFIFLYREKKRFIKQLEAQR